MQKVFGNDNTELQEANEALSKSTEYQRAVESNATINRSKAQSLAQQIKDAWGPFNDDEESIYNALKQLKNKADWLLLVQEYGVNSGIFSDKDLAGDLKSDLSPGEYQNVLSILKARGISIND